MKHIVIVAVLAWSVAARAGAPPLAVHDAGAYSISLPKAWVVVDNAAQGTVIAQQDPKRKDAAQLLVMVSTTAQATADQLLDALLKSGLADAKVVKREALPSNAGTLLVADGKADGIAVRLGAIAIVGNGGSVVGVLIAKRSDFDALGGTATVVSVLATMKAGGATTTTPATTPAETAAPASGGARDAVMTPEYQYRALVIPPPARRLELVDLVAEWSQNSGAATAYVNSHGSYAGFSSVSTSEGWTIDAKGNVADAFLAAYAGTGGTHGVNQHSTGKLAVDTNNTFSIKYPAQNGNKARDEYYIIIGWFVGPEMTLLRVEGPFYEPLTAKNLADAQVNQYMSKTFVTKRTAH